MFTPEELAQPKQPNYSKKDVPMWTVEEDLLILQLVEEHGKKWSKIASHLPGRTDNGVRNRWNRMERAQVLRKHRGPAAGYRCRRCGEPKRGHICAARSIGDEVLEGEELHVKAAALTELSAQAMEAIPASINEELPVSSEQLVGVSASQRAAGAYGAAASTGPPSPPSAQMPASSAIHSATPQPLAPAAPGFSSSVYSAPASAALPLVAAASMQPPPHPLAAAGPWPLQPPHPIVPPSPGASATMTHVNDYLRLSSNEVDDFLDELRRSLEDTVAMPSAQEALADLPLAPPPAAAAPAPSPFAGSAGHDAAAAAACAAMSPATLQTALATLASDWGVDAPGGGIGSAMQLAF